MRARTDAASEGGIDLGGRLRHLRKARGWTLQEMAGRVRLAVSTLSKVENRQISLTYESLLKIAGGLQIDIAELLAEAPVARLDGVLGLTLRRGGRQVAGENYRYEYLCAEVSGKRMVPLLTEVKTATLEAFGPFNSHPGEEFVWVASGTVALHRIGHPPAILHTGDSAYFDSRVGHAFLRVGRAKAAIINVIAISPADPAAQAPARRRRPG
ncbi:MAG: helix-turn-helix domain-containing protein [Acidisphaera sp.]|nr:helix-turn-helix domain-containing protein [Acidisphaera sp.]